MMHKTRPHEAMRSAHRFVIQERERKIKAKEITQEQAEEQGQARQEQGRASQVATAAASAQGSETNNEVDIASATLEEGEGKTQPTDCDARPGSGGIGTAITDLATPEGREVGQMRPEKTSADETASALVDSVVVI